MVTHAAHGNDEALAEDAIDRRLRQPVDPVHRELEDREHRPTGQIGRGLPHELPAEGAREFRRGDGVGRWVGHVPGY
jgi:hypothetical protein